MWANSKPGNWGTNYTILITQSPWGTGVILHWTPWCYSIKCSFRYLPRATVTLLIHTSFTNIMKLFSSCYFGVVCSMNQPQQSCPLRLLHPHRVPVPGHCCLVISCGMQLWNQNSLSLADLFFLWEECRIRAFSWNSKVLFLPCTQMDRSLASKDFCQTMQDVHPQSRQESRTHCSLW